MAKEFKNFFRAVGNNEGAKCHYPIRLDTYGCGCGHNCSYCYAKSQLSVRYKWNPFDPALPDVKKVIRRIKQLEPGQIVRLGGLTDCFQPIEAEHRITYNAIKAMNEQRVGYLLVTKSAMVADDMYMDIMDKELAHIQISITMTDDSTCAKYESASLPSERIAAIEKLHKAGFDVTVRLSPLIPGMYDPAVINAIDCDKLLVEFLRYDGLIMKWFDIDWSEWSVKDANYGHLPLERKKQLLAELTNFKEVSVCEDCSEHYDYWRDHFNPKPTDCCNLRISESQHELNENRRTSEKRLMTKVRFKLKATFSDGHVICNPNVKRTFMDVIAYAGAENVRALGIMRNDCPLVSINPEAEVKEYYRAEVLRDKLPNGMHAFCHMSTDAKANLLMEISEKLGNIYTIEYVEM